MEPATPHANTSQLAENTSKARVPIDLLAELEERGYRLTNQRRILVEELQNAERHLDANELLERANARDASVNRATVYRTLDLLKKLGLVDELDLMHLHGERHYYEVRTGEDHIHLACFVCGRIEEVTSETYNELKEQIQQQSRFSIDAIRLEIGGRCRDCVEKSRKVGQKKPARKR